MRGEGMTRIEVFIDAAFAFAVTILVISFDRIPQTFDEIMLAVKGIPAFAASVTQLVWIWYEYTRWGERFGLKDSGTVALSALLLMIILIYIYPMKIMFAGLFAWLSGGYFPSEFAINSVAELTQMFTFLGFGFFALSANFVLMYRHAVARQSLLRLSDYEIYETNTAAIVWAGAALIGLLTVLLAQTFPPQLVVFSGFALSLLGAWIPFAIGHRMRNRPAAGTANTD